ncbi:hypothetical protein [uncultured Tateyamaria sp.]|uniref:hypothetical protein n=1 Tax=uncultured Tateyamaria sp. TaxID=455651 RepID=UPI0026049296|nr:hypothetical protein [uncultured Tateyamaria sp.]
MPRSPPLKWWHRFGRVLPRRTGAAPNPTKSNRSLVGAVLLTVGLLATAGLVTAIMLSLASGTMPALWTFAAVLISVGLAWVGLILMRSIEGRLWACFFSFATAILATWLAPASAWPTVAGTITNTTIDLEIGAAADGTAPWVLVAGMLVVVVAIAVNRRA